MLRNILSGESGISPLLVTSMAALGSGRADVDFGGVFRTAAAADASAMLEDLSGSGVVVLVELERPNELLLLLVMEEDEVDEDCTNCLIPGGDSFALDRESTGLCAMWT